MAQRTLSAFFGKTAPGSPSKLGAAASPVPAEDATSREPKMKEDPKTPDPATSASSSAATGKEEPARSESPPGKRIKLESSHSPAAGTAEAEESDDDAGDATAPLVDEDEDDEDAGSDIGAEAEGSAGVPRGAAADEPAESKATALNLAKLVLASKYDPVADATFKKGEMVPYLHLCRTFERISTTPSRLDTIVLLCNCFRSILALTPEDLLPTMYLCTNAVAPAHEGLELGVGDALLSKSIADSSGKTDRHVKEQYAQLGDLGLVAQTSRATQTTLVKPKPLMLRSVYQTFREIALAAGKDSGKKRGDRIRTLLVASRETEAQFLIRSLQGKMRIGLAEQTVLSALALALVLTPPATAPAAAAPPRTAERLQGAINRVTERLKTVYSEVPSYDIVIPEIVARGIPGLSSTRCSIANGLPVKPMLAKPTKGISEVLDRFTDIDFTCEFKYDGERAQIHYDEARPAESRILIYSRNSEDHTTKYPDIIATLPRAIRPDVTSFILDSEVVAFDAEEGKIKPFQVLQHRGRKNIALADVKIHVCVHAFDLLYLNGRPLLREPLAARRAALHASLEPVHGAFRFAEFSNGRDEEVIETFFQESLRAGCEGLMVKTLQVDATYQPSKRSLNWLKIKKDYLKGLGDSLDLVPIGGYYGRGKRTGWYGGFLLACYDSESEEFQSVCKVSTGFSEALLTELKAAFDAHIIPQPKPYYRFAEVHRPDVWFSDACVWEVLAADLSISPAHKAAMGRVDPDKGIALRFPRYVRARPDKAPTDATDASQVAEMYRRQFQKK